MMKDILKQVRYSLYLTFTICFVFFQWLAPFEYKCNITNTSCFACGLRTAVDLFCQGKFIEAYNSNKLIVLLVVLSFVALIDVSVNFYKRYIK